MCKLLEEDNSREAGGKKENRREVCRRKMILSESVPCIVEGEDREDREFLMVKSNVN